MVAKNSLLAWAAASAASEVIQDHRQQRVEQKILIEEIDSADVGAPVDGAVPVVNDMVDIPPAVEEIEIEG